MTKRTTPLYQTDARDIEGGDGLGLYHSDDRWPAGGISGRAEAETNSLGDDVVSLFRVARRLFDTDSWSTPPSSVDFVGFVSLPRIPTASAVDPDGSTGEIVVGSAVCSLIEGYASAGNAGLADTRPGKERWSFVVGIAERVEDDRVVCRTYGESGFSAVKSRFYGGADAGAPALVAVEPGAQYYVGLRGCVERVEDVEWAETNLALSFGRSFVGLGTHRGTLFVAGSIGERGDVGSSGFSGQSGQSGPIGRAGCVGYSGKAGSVGVSGTSGVTGFSGASGFSGAAGVGASGFSGASGPSGYSGKFGTRGVRGRGGVGPGETGTSGVTGVSGASGASGVSGASGYPGVSAASGYTGRSGYSGYSGFGDVGYSGYSGWSISGYSGWGPSGERGFSGVTGVYGYESTIEALSGFSGATIPGLDGKSGKSGVSGTKGVPGTQYMIYPNLFVNPSFEETAAEDGSVNAWTLDSSIFSFSTIESRTGARSICCDASAGWGGTNMPYFSYDNYVPLESGITYKVSWYSKLGAWFEKPTFSGVEISFYDADYSLTSTVVMETVWASYHDYQWSTSRWLPFSSEPFLTDSSRCYAKFKLYPLNYYDGWLWMTDYPPFWIDDVMLAEWSTTTFNAVAGSEGPSGVSGVSGFSGALGTSGTTGKSGTSGFSGASGVSGAHGDGASGISGASGTSGVSGTSAQSGHSGVSGTSGATTSSTSGASGISGTSGVTG